MSTRLETARLVIRTFEPRDAEAWLAMFADPEVRRFLPGPAPTREDFQRAIEGRHAMEREGGYAMWALEEKRTGTFVGQCGLGYASEAAVAVLAHGLGPLGLDCIIAVAMPENVGSWRVMEKAGMRYVGLADYYGLEGLKKYIAEPEWWQPPAGLAI